MSDDLERKLERSLIALGVTPAPDPSDWRHYFTPPSRKTSALVLRVHADRVGRAPRNDQARKLGWRIIDGGTT